MARYLAHKGTGTAGAAITTLWQFLKYDDDGDLVPCNAANDIPIGVSVETATEGDGIAYFDLNSSDKIKVKNSGNAISNSAAVGTSGTGLLVAKTTTGNWAIGNVLGDVKAGEIATVKVNPHYVA